MIADGVLKPGPAEEALFYRPEKRRRTASKGKLQGVQLELFPSGMRLADHPLTQRDRHQVALVFRAKLALENDRNLLDFLDVQV